jgi:hypothetical protein
MTMQKGLVMFIKYELAINLKIFIPFCVKLSFDCLSTQLDNHSILHFITIREVLVKK